VFCPQCGTLAFPNPKGDIACTNYKCGYNGPANVVIKGVDGRDVDLSQAKSSTAAKGRKYDVRKDSDKRQGRWTNGHYSCPRCGMMEVFSDVDSNSEYSETATTMLTCKNCKHGWREG
jgi:DNA-directed RNA polymerase subunit M/transcription elongation factor TFIIS